MSFEELLYMTRSQISWQELANKTVKCKSWSAKKKLCPTVSAHLFQEHTTPNQGFI